MASRRKKNDEQTIPEVVSLPRVVEPKEHVPEPISPVSPAVKAYIKAHWAADRGEGSVKAAYTLFLPLSKAERVTVQKIIREGDAP